jgi:hypothetical protein
MMSAAIFRFCVLQKVVSPRSKNNSKSKGIRMLLDPRQSRRLSERKQEKK